MKGEVKFHKKESNKCTISVQVEDTGLGISVEKLDALFEPFAQVHEHGSVEERGSGLGLYISSKIIEDLGGTLGVVSQIDVGSVFKIEFPDITFLKEGGEKGHLTYTFFGDTILIADDYSINVKLYQAYLSKHNLKVETACDGKELVEKTKEMKRLFILLPLIPFVCFSQSNSNNAYQMSKL